MSFQPVNPPSAVSQRSTLGKERQRPTTQTIPRVEIPAKTTPTSSWGAEHNIRESGQKAGKSGTHMSSTEPDLVREQPIRALKIMRSIENGYAQHSSPSLEEQEHDNNFVPQQDTNSEALSYGSSPTTSSQSSPQRSLSNNVGICGTARGQMKESRRNAHDIPARMGGGPGVSRSLCSEDPTKEYVGSQSIIRGNPKPLCGAPAPTVIADCSSSIDQDTNLKVTVVLDETPESVGSSFHGVDRPVHQKRKQDPRVSHLYKRQTDLPTKRCGCVELHPFFSTPGLKYPNIDLFPEKNIPEFLRNVEMVADCAAHEPDLIAYCLLILGSDTDDIPLRKESSFRAAPRGQPTVSEDDISSAEDCLSHGLYSASATDLAISSCTGSSQKSTADVCQRTLSGELEERMRCQSSIAPSVFYGRRRRQSIEVVPSESRPTNIEHAGSNNRWGKVAQVTKQEATPPPSSPVTNRQSKFEDDGHSRETYDSASTDVSAYGPESSRPFTPNSSPLSRKRKSTNGIFPKGTFPPVNDRVFTIQNDDDDDDLPDIRPDNPLELALKPLSQGSCSEKLTKRLRHQSLPATSAGRVVLQGISANIVSPAFSKRAFEQVLEEKFDGFKEELKEYLNHSSATARQDQLPAIAQDRQAPGPPAVVRHGQSTRSRANRPRLTHHIPETERLTDHQLIELGRTAAPYDRHRIANYAFKVRGGLRNQYKRLLDFERDDGTPGWNAEEKFRLVNAG